MEKKIFEKESELFRHSVEMREKSDELTHLKTREMYLIDKSDALEKGQIMNITYYMWFEYVIYRTGVFKRWSTSLQESDYCDKTR